MHNASALAGMAFSNVPWTEPQYYHLLFRLRHSTWPINAILMHVIRFNATKPKKFATWPKYETHIADKRYAEIARVLTAGKNDGRRRKQPDQGNH